MNERIISFLNKDPKKNIAFQGFISNYPADEFHFEGNSLLILSRSDRLWIHISSSSEEETETLIKKYHAKSAYYFSVEDWMIPVIEKYGQLEWVMRTKRYILHEQTHSNTSQSDLSDIDQRFAEYIYEQSDYKEYLSVSYIQDRLEKDISACIIENGYPVAWGFTHDDGALGFLHVLEPHRKKGYAKEILSSLIAKKRNKQVMVFGNILPENKVSIHLVEKVGFEFDRYVSWLKLK